MKQTTINEYCNNAIDSKIFLITSNFARFKENSIDKANKNFKYVG